MILEKNQEVFFALLKAGLWDKEVCLSMYDDIDYSELFTIAEEQSVLGVITAGLEQVKDVKIPQEWILQFIGSTLQIEQRNKSMNQFVSKLVALLRAADIYALLVKGQGIAQCYDKPLWRAAGDVDLYLSKENYEKAKSYLIPLAQNIEQEDKNRLHLGMTIESWNVELHGSMHSGLSKKMNRVSDEVHNSIFYGENIRSWNNNGVQIFLPSANNDIIIIFNHFIDHFYGEGIGLRQVCDWCRLLWLYKNNIDLWLLESRIRKEGLMIEWKAFGFFSVEFLGMPKAIMPFYEDSSSYRRKSNKICKLILETGSFGHNKSYNYRKTSSKFKSNVITLWRRFGEFSRIAIIFPYNAPKYFITYVLGRVKAVS